MSYTKPTISNYNDNPPTNDGSENFVDNGVDWDKHIDEIGDPLNNYIDSVNNAADAQFTVIDNNTSVSVLDYGAKGDGSTDDGPAFQSAIDAVNTRGYGDIIVPYTASGYVWETEVNMNQMKGIVLRGVGSGYSSPVITWAGAASTTMLTMNGSWYSGARNLNFDCDSIADNGIKVYWDNVGQSSFENVFSEIAVQNAVAVGIINGDTSNFQCSENSYQNVYIVDCATGFQLRGQNSHNINLDKIKFLSNGTALDIDGGYVHARNLLWVNNTVRDIKIAAPQSPCVFTGGYSEGGQRFLEVESNGNNFNLTFIGIDMEASSSSAKTTFVQDSSLYNVTWINCEFAKDAGVIVGGFGPIPAGVLNGYKKFINCNWTDASTNNIFPAVTTSAPTADTICVDVDTRHAGEKNFAVDSTATPSIFGNKIWTTANTIATTITNLLHGSYGQEVIIIFGDTNTAVNFSGSNMKGNSGADWTTISVGDSISCVYDGTDWHCTLSASS